MALGLSKAEVFSVKMTVPGTDKFGVLSVLFDLGSALIDSLDLISMSFDRATMSAVEAELLE
jgi:hypothetical protein